MKLGADQRLPGSAQASVRPGEARRVQGHSQCSLLTHIMSTRKRKASSSEEPVCVLCGRADVDPNICGHTLDEKGIRVHQYCLEFAITFTEASLIRLATEGLPLGAIRRAAKHATKQQCFVCGERGAAITCSETGCERSFHLPCAMDGECVTQHFRQRRCYCWEHRPRQEIQEAPEEGTICLICLEPVGDSLSYHTMACPTCQHAWFHRGCIQQQALNAGAFCFYCPGCRDKDQFFQEMATMGIQIPHRRPNWIDEHTYAFLLERHSRCDASECLYHGGREQAERRGPWQLILCSSCAAEGTHRRCSHLSNTRATWECNSCAGLGTASSANTEIAGPSTASQRALEPASGSMEPQNISSMPASQAALGTSQSSQLPEHSELPSVPETEQGTNGPRSSEERATPEQLRGRRGSRRTAAPCADSDSHTSTRRRASGSSRASLAAARRRRPRQQGRSRSRSRSPLQRRDPSSQSRPRRRRGSRRRPAAGEQSGTRRSTRSATSRSPMASRVPRRRGPSRQGGRALSQSPPPGRRQANNSRSSPQRGSRSRAQQQRPSRE